MANKENEFCLMARKDFPLTQHEYTRIVYNNLLSILNLSIVIQYCSRPSSVMSEWESLMGQYSACILKK
jgi:hypothetical protein